MNIGLQIVRSVVRLCGVLLGVVISVVTSTAPCRANDDEALMAQIKSAWSERFQAIGKVRYYLSGSVTYLPGSLVPPGDPIRLPDDKSAANGLPEHESTRPLRAVWTFDFKKTMFRKESHHWSYMIDSRTYRPVVRTDVFNGSELKGLIPREANTGEGHVPGPLDADFEIGSETKAPWFFYNADMPVLYAHGLFQFLPTRLGEGGASILPPLSVTLQNMGASEERVVVLSARFEEKPQNKGAPLEHEYRFWVDMSKDAAIVRWEDRYRSGVANQIVAQWRQHDRHWLPESWTFTKFHVANTARNVAHIHHFRVDRVEIEPEVGPSEFDVSYGPGMIVRRLEDEASFEVAADGKTLRMVVPPSKAKAKAEFSKIRPTAKSWWPAIGCILAGAGLAGIYFRLRVRESH